MADESTFSVLVLTAVPPGLTNEGSGALVKLDGREVLLRSVELFVNRENIRQIQVGLSQENEEEIKRKCGGSLGFMGVKLVAAGRKWQEQIAAAAGKIAAEATHVLIHDASRPVTPFGDIDAILEASAGQAAVALAAAVRSTLVEVDEGGGAMAFHSPSSYMQLMTPWVLSRQRFLELAGGREVHPSEWKLVKGSPLNVRLGSAGDASLAKAMMNLLPKAKSRALSNPFEEAQW
jgi:2-C-methyl-D-erythritol 4-phosphate cytidylyltransferase